MAKKIHKDGMFYKNRYTFISLILLVGMYFIASSYYNPESVVRTGSAQITGEGVPKIGGDFSVVNHEGQAFTNEALQGHYSLMFFGFTHCPDICPTAMTVLSDVYSQLTEKQQKQMQVIMVTVDPERDTVDVMKDYVHAFNDNFIGLTGSMEQIKDMAKKYLVYYAKRPADDMGNYSVDHSGYIYFMGPDGRYVKHFSHKDNASDILKVVQSYLRK